MEELNKKLDELFDILNQYPDIIEMIRLKKEIIDDDIALINNYRLNPTVSNKEKIYQNEKLKEYLMLESSVNYLIMEINKHFKRGNCCENN